MTYLYSLSNLVTQRPLTIPVSKAFFSTFFELPVTAPFELGKKYGKKSKNFRVTKRILWNT